ncbi:diuretic hormone receptor-like isoform X2 [Adelges cooleyi]|uniref:diuretic hormone receptor-like isoform X2 n=1 Tax=Adelges cooleyi TaxID=133065 RepID=UPI0021801F2D|nr:diuretic hormone receptor-like isoform X2 [Adelges cooleyi]XP_050435595.1 diuretic hormone receptor-like isoform X2 [Adelges cooleyi]
MDIINSTWIQNEEAAAKCRSLYRMTDYLNWNGCNASSDTLICWPPTQRGNIAYQPCFAELQGLKYDVTKNASRICYENRTWGLTDFSQCEQPLTELIIPVVPTDDEEGTVNTIIYLYIAGHCLSVIMTSLAIIVFYKFKELKCLRNKIHMNLMASYLLSAIMWIITYTILFDAGVEECLMVALPLYYFTVTNYFWAFIEGMYLFILVVDTFFPDRLRLRTYMAIGWGIPLIIIPTWCVTKLMMPTKTDLDFINQKTYEACPLMADSTDDLIFQLPVAIVLLANSLFLLIIMWVLITKLRSTNCVETHNYKKATKALLVLIPLLGITFCLDIIKLSSTDLIVFIYKYSKAVIISTQGSTVSLLYCFFNHEVQNTLKYHVLRWKTKRSFITSRKNYGRSWTSIKKPTICDQIDPKELMPWIPSNNVRSSSCVSNGTTTSALSNNLELPQDTTIEMPPDSDQQRHSF